MSVLKRNLSMAPRWLVVRRLEIVAFIAGVSVMMLEILGSRLLAPYLGTSIYVWTSLIGIILGSLSLGYLLGGKLADRKPSEKLLAEIFFLCFTLYYFFLFFSKM